MFNQSKFINTHITKREKSYFDSDLNKYEQELKAQVHGKAVLVIGGAGTIGSSFIKALLPFKPKSLHVVDYNENGLTELTRDLRSSYNDHVPPIYVTYPFDFGSNVFKKFFLANKFDVVACFAAHKHVRSEKDHYAIEAMIHNNVINTKKLLDLCVKNPPSHFFAVSTDKAANPVNVMGASKKLMEKVLMAYGQKLKISTARFANVAFSNGSLLFGFNERLAKKQPLSSPNDVKRYFVSPEESGQLCLIACLLGKTKEIFFPKLYENSMLTFSEIAVEYLKSQDLEPYYCSSEQEAREKAIAWTHTNKEYPVYFFKTDTSGEKQFEEFYTQEDIVDLNLFTALGVIKNESNESLENVESIIKNIKNIFADQELDKAKIISFLKQHLLDFQHIEAGKSLDQKM